MQLNTRPRFYLDVAEEVEYLATKAGAETALRWKWRWTPQSNP